jgi:hypothetical protein
VGARPGGGSPPNLLGIALVATAGLVAVVVTFGIFLPAFGEVSRMATRDPATLPGTITVCDRDWQRDSLARTFTAGEIYERTEADPIVVSVGLFPACPPEVAAPAGDQAGMPTSVWVEVGDDAYVGYDLVGGP